MRCQYCDMVISELCHWHNFFIKCQEEKTKKDKSIYDCNDMTGSENVQKWAVEVVINEDGGCKKLQR